MLRYIRLVKIDRIVKRISEIRLTPINRGRAGQCDYSIRRVEYNAVRKRRFIIGRKGHRAVARRLTFYTGRWLDSMKEDLGHYNSEQIMRMSQLYNYEYHSRSGTVTEDGRLCLS